MAISDVKMKDLDGAIGVEVSNASERVSGLIFDISSQTDIWTKVDANIKKNFENQIVELNSLDDAKALGLAEPETTADVASAFLGGIPFYHIKHYFQHNGGAGILYVAFADCSKGWDIIGQMQRTSNGLISQFGVWTERPLWKLEKADAEKYTVDIVDALQLVANSLADDDCAPAVIILNANTAKVKTASGILEGTVTLSKIPTLKNKKARNVAVAISQDSSDMITAMQSSLASATPVGNVGTILGILSTSNVAENIGWTAAHNVSNYFPEIELGFGEITTTTQDGKTIHTFTNTTSYASLTAKQLDTLHDNGYIFLRKHAGNVGQCFFNGDSTCSNGDYRTIARNRVMNKSRRNVRNSLLPYVNAPIKLDPATGQLSTAQIAILKTRIDTVLKAMADGNEISGIASINIPAKQNVLQNDRIILKYTIIPLGTSSSIEVTQGVAVSQ